MDCKSSKLASHTKTPHLNSESVLPQSFCNSRVTSECPAQDELSNFKFSQNRYKKDNQMVVNSKYKFLRYQNRNIPTRTSV